MRVETSSILDLPGTHKMGHTCANLNGELLFIWGGSDENVDYQLSIRRDNQLWIYETLTGYWRNRTCSGECPPRLSGTTSALINQRMYIFGGHSTICDNWLNSLYCLDLETFIWKDLGTQAEAEPTKPIPSDKCVSWSYEGQLYIFGGYGWSQTEHLLELLDRQKDLQLTPDYRWPKFGWNNQLIEFNTRTNKWRWPSYSGKCPSARAAHSGALMGNKYFLFGGRDSRERLNDLYSLDMLTLEWTQITTFSDPSSNILERPIRHLLESLLYDDEEEEVEDNDTNQAQVLNYEINSEAQEINMEDDADLINQAREEEQLTPSPSSSNPLPDTSADLLNFVVDEDEADFQFNYTHPSHLLERWSLSSHQSASTDISSSPQVNCLYEQLPSYQQQSDSTAQLPNYLCIHNDDPSHLTQTLQPQPSEQEQQADQDSLSESSPLQPLQQPQDVPHTPLTNDFSQSNELLPHPVGRSFSSFTPVSSGEIILYGGISSQDENLADCWIFNIKNKSWTQIDLKVKHTRLWHTASRTKNNEIIVIGGSCSNKVDEFCSDVLTMSLEPKSLKKLSLDSVAKSIRMRSIHRVKNLPSTIGKLIKLRKQAIALTMRRYHRPAAH